LQTAYFEIAPSQRTEAARRGAVAWLALLLLAILLAWLPLHLAAGFVAAAAVGVLTLRWPWLIWLPLAALTPVASGLRFGPASATDLLLAVGVGLWLLDGARQRTLSLRWSPVSAAATVYVAVLFASLFFAADLGEGVREVIKWLELAVLLLVAPALLTMQRARWLAAALVFGACIQAALGLYQFIFRIGPEHFVIMGRFMRASGVFDQPNPFGGFLGLALPVALSLALWAWGEFVQRGGRWINSLWALYYTAATALIGLGLLASWSRGAWLGAVVGVLVVLVVRSRRAAILSAIGALAVAGMTLLGAFSPTAIPQPISERLADLPAYFGWTDVLSQPVTDENFSVVERIAHWTAAQRMWERSPWFGVGAGNYAAVYPEVRLPRWEDPLGHAHNIYLNVLGETGIVGLASFIVLWGAVVVWTWQRARNSDQSNRDQRWLAAVAVGVLGLVAHLSVHNLVDNLFVRGIVVYIGLWFVVIHSKS
jgi:O-antigen ligase